MFWKSIDIDNYIPFTHSGIKHVSVDFTSPVTAFLGTNGCGKSSLLRALTPYPPARTEFGNNGKITKVLEHNGSVYELVSDFSNSASPHSFKKDGVELNLSGTTDTQKDLIEENFGITKLLDEIAAGDIKICQTSKSDRKNLFSSMYPGDLSFVLDYHKQVCSQSRACANQLKLLKSREAAIRSSLIDKSEIDRFSTFKESATNVVKVIDKCMIILEEEIKHYESMRSNYSLPDGNDELFSSENIGEVLSNLKNKFLGTIRSIKDKCKLPSNSEKDLLISQKYHQMTSEATKKRMSVLSAQIDDISSELSRFIAYKEASTSASEKNSLETRFRICSDELTSVASKLGSVTSAPISSNDISGIESELIPMVSRWVEVFNSESSKLMPQEELSELSVRIEHSKMILNTEIGSSLSQIASEIANIDDKLARLTRNSYPESCREICQLRLTVEENIASAKRRREDLIQRRKDIHDQAIELNRFINENSPIIGKQTRLHIDVRRLVGWLNQYGVYSVVFGNEDPISFCNDHCLEIVNKLVNACSVSRFVIRRDELRAEIDSIQKTLEKLSETKQLQMSMNIIDSTIADRESKLDIGIKELESLESNLKEEDEISDEINEAILLRREFDIRSKDAERIINLERIDLIVDFDKGLMRDLESAKFDINSELFSINEVLNNQKKYLDILESEILPTTEKIEKDKTVLDAIANGLSPTDGLPCIYLIRFINRLITRANKVIAKVWMYGMEMIYLDEKDSLDFSIKVRIRGSSSVKDISTLSVGQQTIANLAMSIAIMQERDLFSWMAIRLDEVDTGLIDEHRTRLVCMLSDLIEKEKIRQMFLVNHFAMQAGLNNCDSVCLNTEGIVVPDVYNEHAIIE